MPSDTPPTLSLRAPPPALSPRSPGRRDSRRGPTAADAIHRDLRAEIVSLKRKPGEPIVEKQIAEAYGVSRTPVREAVLKLADEGLIEIFPQSGTFVARIPLGALPEAGVIRKVLERATVRFAAERATRSQVAALHACLERQREVDADGDADGFHQADEAFHAHITEMAGYPGFWTIIQQAKVQLDRCRRLTLPVPGRMRTVIAEHEAIVEGIATRDADEAERCLIRHLDNLQITVDDVRNAAPLYFSGNLTDGTDAGPGDPP
ncbi:GntR family transcriptional regulator [Azospirillum picis]|uniref:DNA-binding GntR family transcriptional regulator n=1 Tax=Azospirillum picis TaxID=488438 RepID=A0ABU0MD75_9PROT|nr:GntR family transcriptional regulator [Azospirillum picis]MBP2297597.1 DNA-binding GntR family transcriptional regulator [Azospirillum picis]MDQ0531380.1 DNA-binding GntR family transcriptional regulator [Azospirillum picis]